MTLIESFVVLSGGVLLLGFSGSSFTKGIAERYLSYVVSVGVKLFTIYLVMGVGVEVASGWGQILSTEATRSPEGYLQIASAAPIFAFIAWYIPGVASSILSGSVSLSFGDVSRSVRGSNAQAISSVRGLQASVAAPTLGAAAAVGPAGAVGWDTVRTQTSAGATPVQSALRGAATGGKALAVEGARAAVRTLGGQRYQARDRTSAAERIKKRCGSN